MSARDTLELLTIDEVAELLGLKKWTIRRKVRDGSFPAPIRLSEQTNRWRARDVEAWLQALAEKGDAKKKQAPIWLREAS
ncbi:helix-turn-helix transcriptional regulator [Methyloceanibacter sp.]|uniref:helix-turn-helix transcriptional regulator n=1 Tax=Methyloceanibacter sp. TaxID=1965321 RepID=UPI0039C9EEE3